MDPDIIEHIERKITEVKEGTGWGRVCVVIERRRVSCVEVTDSAKIDYRVRGVTIAE